ncbi:MAG: hypothetical protein HC879_05990 [Leptolyngbyaceae cyanobacterium SL_5_9]|nr:hypothetical protein [Leptolyngbyaceae cyanobacterium SL_5_9]
MGSGQERLGSGQKQLGGGQEQLGGGRERLGGGQEQLGSGRHWFCDVRQQSGKASQNFVPMTVPCDLRPMTFNLPLQSVGSDRLKPLQNQGVLV